MKKLYIENINGYRDFLNLNDAYSILNETQYSYTIICDLGFELVLDKGRFSKIKKTRYFI